VRGGRRWRWLSCGPPCLDLGPELGWVIIKWAEVMHPTSIFAQAPRLASRPLACRPRTQRKPPAAARTHSMTRKRARMKETRLGKRGRGDSHAEGGGACTRPTKKNTTPARRRAPAALGCHDPATPNAQAATPPSHRTSLALWRWIIVRDVSFGGAAMFFFFCAALNKRPSLCGVSWWSAGFAQGGASANLVW
jgi:hypothetical protein